MESKLSKQIRWGLIYFLDGQVTLRDFAAWLAENTWNINADGDPSLANFVNQINLRIDEYTNGHWTREELQRQLWKIATVLPYPQPKSALSKVIGWPSFTIKANALTSHLLYSVPLMKIPVPQQRRTSQTRKILVRG